MNNDYKQIAKVVSTALAIGGIGFFCLVFLLQPIFSGSIILPQTVNLLGIELRYYGLLLGLSVLAAYWLLIKRNPNINQTDVDSIILWVVLGGFIGARLYHVIIEYHLYLENPLQAFAIWQGGLSIFGAILGGVAALYLYAKKTGKYAFGLLLDWIIPGVVLGQIIGRFGNFFNYELYGTPTDLPWKMFVPLAHRTQIFADTAFYHPLFLYEIMGSLIILVILLWLKPKTGGLFLIWLFLYNLMRFFLEFLRVDSVLYSGIRVNALVALGLVILSIILWNQYKTRNYVISPPFNN